MLLGVIVISILVVLGVVYFVPRKIWYVIGMTLIYQIKYHYIGFISQLDDIINARHNKTDLPLVPNKIAIVTGGSKGIGAEVVKKLLQCDMEVIIACRTTTAGEKLILEIRKSGITSGRAKVYKLDNCSLESVREFAKKIKADYDKIHILINNAGVMFIPYRETEDGFEEQWAVNYLSHFLLVSLLLPLLKAGGHPGDCSRIINVTSCAHYIADIDFASISNSSKNTFFTQAAYGQSKLAQTIFTITLQKLLTDKTLNVLVYSVHPGLVKTDLFKDTLLGRNKWLMIAWKTPDQGAISIIYAALNKDIERKGGIYISNCKEAAPPPLALEEQIQKQLFELSLRQIRLNNFFQHL
ncbi:dehydrogenase/reductase SDR family member on chromosome X-like [Cataglyphis hispanica]|uniref:dehydrogenase/reductase SDR family member on chromosome X-like n=1 Tax=Cataglyphis hispanica TaxID=1086592 RepID=UPI00217F84B5|nr:dehydrogenase/reductase SDR family member on chromosome X-like [Cataglyphis hispanica]XP_050450588.1 dehydrogenase/reductase SDR family member on chromosome X-like [Cataglyphis hispanica]XP_050450589.1 dehydrogenase/reductase SDR family member on chromosome X-like [Cataglyphis hispanica]XP_050450590.1 dehydrogenase/reductase SDR family member on chromosome X-like [Cataglyphis hispanica]XP_050450591.1 dehydrogenase/reductase SDR family member on chromosome X-like [Cataglyphis hispanica]XP_05